MPIINPGDFPIDPAIVDGTELAARLNRVMLALASEHSNATRPPYITAGGVWTQITPTGGFDLMMYDGTRDYKIGGIKTGAAAFGGFEAGTVMLFKQSAPPVGWTKITSDNDAAIRIVSGSVGTGGTVAFATAFANHAITGTVAGHALSIAEMPSHNHNGYAAASIGSSFGAAMGGRNAAGDPGLLYLASEGGNQPHTHGFSAPALDLAVKYVDVIAASKD